jgi:peroxiredoxin
MIKTSMKICAFILALGVSPAMAAVEVGQKAPDFEAVDVEGNAVKLSDYEGQPVVIEWTNHQCPFVVKHYDSGNMQKTQKEAMEKGAAWIAVVSSAPGKQGHIDAEKAGEIIKNSGAHVSHKILDESGEIGKMYDAKTTPHMFVVDAEGMVAYAGAIDSIPSADKADVAEAENYVLAAIDSLNAGEPVETAETQPYGCSVKY